MEASTLSPELRAQLVEEIKRELLAELTEARVLLLFNNVGIIGQGGLIEAGIDCSKKLGPEPVDRASKLSPELWEQIKATARTEAEQLVVGPRDHVVNPGTVIKSTVYIDGEPLAREAIWITFDAPGNKTIVQISMSPTDPNQIDITTEDGMQYYTLNGGATWLRSAENGTDEDLQPAQ